MDPNSQHQIWSHWTFRVREAGRHVTRVDVEYNVARWLKKGFGSVGEVRVQGTRRGWLIQALVEGVPAHDQAFVADVRKQFQKNFIERGWGPMAYGFVWVRVVAGDTQDGGLRDQLVVINAGDQ